MKRNIIFIHLVIFLGFFRENYGQSVTISWDAVTNDVNGSPESDGVYYNIYCETFPYFTPGADNFLVATLNTQYVHTDSRLADPNVHLYYIVTAVDKWGNQSAYSERVGESEYVLANVRIFLQTFYSAAGDTMSTRLYREERLPLVSPYPQAPVTLSSMPQDMVDWVLAELVRGMFRMLWNSYSFFVLYANIDGFRGSQNVERVTQEKGNLLDRWIVSELQLLIKNVNTEMESYELTRAARLFPKFIDNLSNWYIRRSRKRFWKSENDTDKNEAYETLHYVLVTLAKVMAPFTPFVAEEIWRNLAGEPSLSRRLHRDISPEYRGEGDKLPPSPVTGRGAGGEGMESVHLCDFPVADEDLIEEELNAEMEKVRNIITEALQLRAKAGIKVRQPLEKFSIFLPTGQAGNFQFSNNELNEIIKEELNVKKVEVVEKIPEGENWAIGEIGGIRVGLNIEITEDLRLEGAARELIRHIQEMRKEAGYEVDNRIKVCYSPQSVVFEKFGDLIAKETLADELKYAEKSEDSDLQKEFVIEGRKLLINIKR